MSNHTPGPWDREHITPRITNIISNTPEKSIVCSLDVPEHGSKLANARLIAAAPDMLDALAYVVNWHREHDGFGLDYVTTCISALRKVDPEWCTSSSNDEVTP